MNILEKCGYLDIWCSHFILSMYGGCSIKIKHILLVTELIEFLTIKYQ